MKVHFHCQKKFGRVSLFKLCVIAVSAWRISKRHTLVMGASIVIE